MSGMKIRVLSGEDVRRALPMKVAIAGMKRAFAGLSLGEAEMPLRTRVAVPEAEGLALFMPAVLSGEGGVAVKVVSVFPRNVQAGLPIVYASVLVLDEATGRPLALLEGRCLTAIRTGAGGGASVDVLARPDACTLALLGSGVQARAGLEAVCAVRDIEEVRVYSPTREHAERLAGEMGHLARIRVVDAPSTAVRGADIIYTATTASTPTFAGADVKAGAHIVGVGSYTPTMQEVDAETVRRALVVVDSRASALAEAGDITQAVASGAITEAHIYAELGEIVAGRKVGRTSAEQVTFFKSVGVAVQDVVAAKLALDAAVELDLGTLADF